MPLRPGEEEASLYHGECAHERSAPLHRKRKEEKDAEELALANLLK